MEDIAWHVFNVVQSRILKRSITFQEDVESQELFILASSRGRPIRDKNFKRRISFNSEEGKLFLKKMEKLLLVRKRIARFFMFDHEQFQSLNHRLEIVIEKSGRLTPVIQGMGRLPYLFTKYTLYSVDIPAEREFNPEFDDDFGIYNRTVLIG